jgi:hypothetical protein
MKKFVSALVACGVVVALCAPVLAQDPGRAAASRSCFLIHDFQNWRAPDDKTLYIRVAGQRYYRLDMGTSCPEIKWPGAHLITKTRGTESVCSAVDWDLKVSPGPSGLAQSCIVKTMTPLTSAEVAAIPKAHRP